MTRRTAFDPLLEPLRCFFKVGKELLVSESLAPLGNNSSDAIPNAIKLSAGFKEQVFVQQAMVKVSTGLLPVAEDHHYQGSIFRARRCDAHGVLKCIHEIITEIPVACLA